MVAIGDIENYIKNNIFTEIDQLYELVEEDKEQLDQIVDSDLVDLENKLTTKIQNSVNELLVSID